MASGEVAVTFEAIEGAAADTRVTNQTIQTQLEDLYRSILPMISVWSGAAAEAFQYQHSLWVQAADDLSLVLGAISALLEDTHSGYSEAEANVTALWS